MNHVELFAGIGGFRQALTLLQNDFGIHQKTVAFSEIDESAVRTYKSAFDTTGEIEIGDIVAFCEDKNLLSSLPDFTLLTGGFPCQAFSMMGKQKGFDDMRGNVFFKILDVLKSKKPKYVLLENVRNLLTHDGGKTFAYIIKSIQECGYHTFYDVFNTNDFGLAQKRNRVFIFATTEEIDGFKFDSKSVKDSFDVVFSKTSLQKQKTTHDILDKKVDDKYYLSDTIKPTILANGTKNFKSKSEINPIIAKPLTATMVKMHRACQDNYFSDGYIQADNPLEYVKKEYSKEELCSHRIRKLTPKEAFLLQGFDESFFSKIENTGNSNSQLYKQAGNAVSVNTVYAIMYYLFYYMNLG